MDIKLLNIEDRKLLDTTFTYRNSGRGWIEFGPDNLFPTHIANIVSRSATQSAILQTKLKLTIGEGLSVNKLVNPKESLEQIIRKITLDYLTFGGFSIRVVYRNGVPAKFYHTDFTKVRSGVLNDYNEVDHYYLKADWRTTRSLKDNKTIIIPAYGACNDEKVKETLGELFYFSSYTPDSDYYPRPDWYGAKDEVILDYELSNYLSAILSNGHFPKQMIFVNEQFTPEEELDFQLLMKQNFKGTNRAGEPMIITGLKREDSVSIKELDYKIIDPQFKEAVELVTNKIVEANRIPRVVAGLESKSGFSSEAENLRTSFELFNNMVIKAYQRELKQALSPIVGDFDFVIVDIVTAQASEDTLNRVLTIDEYRTKFGFEPLGDNKYVKE